MSTSSGVTDRLRYVMIVSMLEHIHHQKLERNLSLKKNYGEVKIFIEGGYPRERLRYSQDNGTRLQGH